MLKHTCTRHSDTHHMDGHIIQLNLHKAQKSYDKQQFSCSSSINSLFLPSLVPRVRGGGGTPGIHCLRMRLISQMSGKIGYFP